MSEPSERYVVVGGSRCRVWEKGDGPVVGFLAGYRGVPYWTPFLDRLANQCRVVVPSLPGFPGAEPGHRVLDDTVDWITMILDLLDATGLAGSDLIAESLGAMLALEAAALAPTSVARLVMIGALGWSLPEEPVRNPFTTHMPDVPPLFCENQQAYARAFHCRSRKAEDINEHEILLYRADEAAARLTWPFADRGLRKRLHRVSCPTLIVWGERDRIVPASYAARYAAALRAPTRIAMIPGAGHLATIDAPDAVAEVALPFLAR